MAGAIRTKTLYITMEDSKEGRVFHVSLYYYKDDFAFQMREEGGRNFRRQGKIVEAIEGDNYSFNMKIKVEHDK